MPFDAAQEDALDRALLDAAERTESPRVAAWLRALVERGERAGSAGEDVKQGREEVRSATQ